MSAPIYLINDDGALIEMHEEPYAAEDRLQELLASYPELLAGDQSLAAGGGWVLVTREAALPSEKDGSARWSVDHLFLDREGVPTLVEVKRSSDPRIRREVIGQMLDYAANAVMYWPIEQLREFFERTSEQEGTSPDDRLHHLLGEADPEEFWVRVKTNLQAGRIRMIFVADEIPRELRRIVEFLNEQMDPAEVLAIEVRQFIGEGRRTLVPKTIGQTAESEKKKAPHPRDQKVWNEKLFLAELEGRHPAEAEVASEVLQWAERSGMRIWWGKGRVTGSMIPALDYEGVGHSLVSLWTNGTFSVQFGYMKTRPPFTNEKLRAEFARKLSALPGISIPRDSINRFPSAALITLRDPEVRRGFIETLDWALEQIRSGGDRATASNEGMADSVSPGSVSPVQPSEP